MIQIGNFQTSPETGYSKHVSNITADILAERCLETLENRGVARDSWEWFSVSYLKSGQRVGEIPREISNITIWGRPGGSEGHIFEIGGVTRENEYIPILSGKTFHGMDFVLNCVSILTREIELG
jgi:hypothetical protein